MNVTRLTMQPYTVMQCTIPHVWIGTRIYRIILRVHIISEYCHVITIIMTGATIRSSPMTTWHTTYTSITRCYKTVSVCALLTRNNPTKRSTQKENAAFCRISALRHHFSIHPDSYYDKVGSRTETMLTFLSFTQANEQSGQIKPTQPFPDPTVKLKMTGDRKQEMSAMRRNKERACTQFCSECNRQQSLWKRNGEGNEFSICVRCHVE